MHHASCTIGQDSVLIDVTLAGACRIGRSTMIGGAKARTQIGYGVAIGDHCIVGHGTTIERDALLHDHVIVGEDVRIGPGTVVGPRATIVSHATIPGAVSIGPNIAVPAGRPIPYGARLRCVGAAAAGSVIKLVAIADLGRFYAMEGTTCIAVYDFGAGQPRQFVLTHPGDGLLYSTDPGELADKILEAELRAAGSSAHGHVLPSPFLADAFGRDGSIREWMWNMAQRD